VQVKIAARHGHLSEPAQQMIRDKAEKLLHFFDRLTMIEVIVDLNKAEVDRCHVEIKVQAEHKHDFVATDAHTDVMTAVDMTLHKLEGQLRRYKEKIQDHRRTPTPGRRPSGPALSNERRTPAMRMSDFVCRNAILPSLNASSKEAVVRQMVESLASTGLFRGGDQEDIVRAILKRELLGSTASARGWRSPTPSTPASSAW